jgi:hypothetical protein
MSTHNQNSSLKPVNSATTRFHQPSHFARNGNSTSELFPLIPLRLPARLNAEQSAKVLGFAPHDIPVLVRKELLNCLGNPNQSSVKHFAACEIEACAADFEWLHNATIAIGNNWNEKNTNRKAAGAPQISEGSKKPTRFLRAAKKPSIDVEAEVTHESN